MRITDLHSHLPPLLLLLCTLSGVGTASETGNVLPRLFPSRATLKDATVGQTGVFPVETILSSGLERRYRMVVPENYDPSRPIGVLFGYGQKQETLPYLSEEGFERDPGTPYWITASMERYPLFPSNWLEFEIHFALDVLERLKSLYNIDEDRIYAIGTSKGTMMVTALAEGVPDLFAGVATLTTRPKVLPPLASCSLYSAFIDLGPEDSFHASSYLQQFMERGIDAEYHHHRGGHADLTGNYYVWPGIRGYQMVTEYFLRHPRGHTEAEYPPSALGAGFRDDFDPTPGAANQHLPDSTRWRVDRFDEIGVMAFTGLFAIGLVDGYLADRSTEPGPIGSVCWSQFLPKPTLWRTSFVLDDIDSDLEVWPVLLRDMSGKTLYLTFQTGTWRWRVATTCAAMRSNYAPTITEIASGAASLVPDVTYTFEFQHDNPSSWFLYGEGPVLLASGTLPASAPVMRECQFGLGMRRTNARARFDYVEAEPSYAANRVDARDLLALTEESRQGEPPAGFGSADFHPDESLDELDFFVAGGQWYWSTGPAPLKTATPSPTSTVTWSSSTTTIMPPLTKTATVTQTPSP